MSTYFDEEIFQIGKRLREERERLEISPAEMASRLLTTRRTIDKYEKGDTSPRATELLTLSSIGADVLYIVTGIRIPLGVAEGRTAYSPAERLGERIAELKLSEEDADLLMAMARRLAH